MEKKSTIQPVLIPLKANYEKLNKSEQDNFNSLSEESLSEELRYLDVLDLLPAKELQPSQTSINIVLEYSKRESKKDFVC